MRKVLGLALVSVAIAGCADRTDITSPNNVSKLQVPGDGDPTYYSSSVNTTYYGGYSGYNNPDAARSAVYTEELMWSGASNFWDIRETFSPNYGPFGAESPSEPGVSQALRTRYDAYLYDRGGQIIYQPDATYPLSSAPPDAAGNVMVQPMMAGLADRPALSVARSPENVPGREALDARVVTPAAAARSLARLRSTAVEVSSNPDKIVFEIRRGNGRSLLTFTPAFGTVTHARVEDPDGTIAETDYEYSAARGGFVLTQERTTIQHANASQPLSIVRKYTNTSIR